MLTRRSLLAGSAALAVGCGRAKPPVSQPVQLNLAAYLGLVTMQLRGMGCYEGAYQDVMAALAQDPDNPFGPERGRYRLSLRMSDEFFQPPRGTQRRTKRLTRLRPSWISLRRIS